MATSVLAPGRFSVTTVCLKAASRPLATTLAQTSLMPPGANGHITVIAREGYSASPHPAAGNMANAVPAKPCKTTRRLGVETTSVTKRPHMFFTNSSFVTSLGAPRHFCSHSIKRRGRGHEQAASVLAAPDKIGRFFRQPDHAKTMSAGMKYMDSTRPSAKEIARAVDFHSVGSAGLISRRHRPHLTAGNAAVRLYVKAANVFAHGIVHEELRLIQRKAKTVRLLEIVGQ